MMSGDDDTASFVTATAGGEGESNTGDGAYDTDYFSPDEDDEEFYDFSDNDAATNSSNNNSARNDGDDGGDGSDSDTR